MKWEMMKVRQAEPRAWRARRSLARVQLRRSFKQGSDMVLFAFHWPVWQEGGAGSEGTGQGAVTPVPKLTQQRPR